VKADGWIDAFHSVVLLRRWLGNDGVFFLSVTAACVPSVRSSTLWQK